jgi:CheY-like chemotaxis protein
MVAISHSPVDHAGSLKVMVSDVRDQYSEPLRVLLEPHGFTIHRVRSGADAIWLAEHRAVDAAVLDNDLPDMPGLRVLRAIRSLGAAMPIILVGRSSLPAEHEHLLRAALELHAFSVLAQPVDLEVLMGQMARLFDQFLRLLRAPGALPGMAGSENWMSGSPTRDENTAGEEASGIGDSGADQSKPLSSNSKFRVDPGEGAPGDPGPTRRTYRRIMLRFRRRRT